MSARPIDSFAEPQQGGESYLPIRRPIECTVLRLPSIVGAIAVLEAAGGQGRRLRKCPTCWLWHVISEHPVMLAMIDATAQMILTPGWSAGDLDPSDFGDPDAPIRHRARR